MGDIFVIEKMVVIGVWELMSNTYYTDEKVALDNCLHIIKTMQKTDKNFCARVTKLEAIK